MAWTHRKDEDIRRQAREGVMPFDWEAVLENYWKPFLDEIAGELPQPLMMPELAKVLA